MDRRALLSVLGGFPIARAIAASAPPPDTRLPLVATFTILADLCRQIGGDSVAVTSLVGPDVDPHSYEPRPSDLRAVAQARMLVKNGLGLEGWMSRLPVAAHFGGIVIEASGGVVARRLTEYGTEAVDPHAWQDPRNGVIYVRNIAAGLARVAPAHADRFKLNADALTAKIQETDVWIEQRYSDIPPSKRRIITSHDAFGYYASRYGIEIRAVEGLSTDSEPSAHAIAKLADQVKRDRIKAVFVENMTDPRLAKALADASGAVLGPAVYSDALSKPSGPAGTYVDMLRYNTTTFVGAMAAN